ncbi:MAG TPA: hypothetical protein VGN00_29740 [Puia sp.]
MSLTSTAVQPGGDQGILRGLPYSSTALCIPVAGQYNTGQPAGNQQLCKAKLAMQGAS